MANLKITYEYPIYQDMLYPIGFLTLDKREHALMNYYLSCMKLLQTAGKSIDDQIRYDDEAWLDKPYGNIALGVAVRYQLESPEAFLHAGIKRNVQLEIARRGWPRPDPEFWNVTPGKVVYT